MLLSLLAALAFWTGDAQAKGDEGTEGVLVKVKVLDVAGAAVPTAVIRHPDEADRHRVNAQTGEWSASVLYLPDGSEMIFTPGMVLTLEISAPGFMTKIIQYDIRKRKNNLEVALDALPMEEESIEEPVMQFGRDRPRDAGGSGPAN
jgi:hypothetical protein